MNEIRAADLRFTAQEMLEFFNETMRLGLGPEDISALENRRDSAPAPWLASRCRLSWLPMS